MKPWIMLSVCGVFLLLLSMCACGEFVSLGPVESVTETPQCVDVKLSNALLRVYVVSSNVMRIRITKERFSEAPSYAVINQERAQAAYTLKRSGGIVLISTPELKLRIEENPCRITFADKEGYLLNEDEKSFGVTFDEDEVRCFKKLFKDERFFGLGEKTGFLERTGEQYEMWNSDYPFYTKKTDPLYVSIPFFIGIRERGAYGIFFDNTHRSHFNMGASNDRFYWFGAEKGEMDYYFIYGPKAKRVITSYTELTGRMELPPLWALGFQQCRWSYRSEDEVREIARQFRSRKIPCDVIYLDIDYMDGYRVFTWNRERFPDPKNMISLLGSLGFKLITIIDPGVKADESYFAAREGLEKDLFVKYPDGLPYRGEVWPSWAYFPDFTSAKTRIWWGEKLSILLEAGVAGFWNDMNEPAVWGKSVPDIIRFDDNGYGADHKKIHNVFALEMAKATYDGLTAYSGRRPFILTRAGFSGTQRYAAVWTGDNVANEDHLLLACLMPQSMGISGLPFTGSDVGGFGGCPTSSLYLRWLELGVFTPFFRAHSCIDEPHKEPWAFGESAERMAKEILSMRYRMLPFLYNEFYRSTKTGLPIISPLLLSFQGDLECFSKDAQKEFMIGDHMLVAPVLSEHENSKRLYLPEGRWMHLEDHRIYGGNQWITVDAPLSKIPLFLKSGAIIPQWEAQQWVGEKEIGQVELIIFPSESSSYDYYEDDGISRSHEKGVYSITTFEVNRLPKEDITIRISKKYDRYKSNTRAYLFRLYDTPPVKTIRSGGMQITRYESEKALLQHQEGYSIDEAGKTILIKIQAALPREIEIRR